MECSNGFTTNVNSWYALGSQSEIETASDGFGRVCESTADFNLIGHETSATKIWPSGGEKYAVFRAVPVDRVPSSIVISFENWHWSGEYVYYSDCTKYHSEFTSIYAECDASRHIYGNSNGVVCYVTAEYKWKFFRIDHGTLTTFGEWSCDFYRGNPLECDFEEYEEGAQSATSSECNGVDPMTNDERCQCADGELDKSGPCLFKECVSGRWLGMAIACMPVYCADGTTPPPNDGQCCPSTSNCPDACTHIMCPAVVCFDGSNPPIPEGECCGNHDLCPTFEGGWGCPAIGDSPGSSISSIPVLTLDECKFHCGSNPNCLSIGYDFDGTCTLYDRQYNDSFVGGLNAKVLMNRGTDLSCDRPRNTIYRGESIYSGTVWTNLIGQSFSLESDGNMVIRDVDRSVMWESGTGGQRWPTMLTMQFDGNLVLYRKDTMNKIWSSGTYGRTSDYATFLDDGSFEIACYNTGMVLWRTETECDDCRMKCNHQRGNIYRQNPCRACPDEKPVNGTECKDHQQTMTCYYDTVNCCGDSFGMTSATCLGSDIWVIEETNACEAPGCGECTPGEEDNSDPCEHRMCDENGFWIVAMVDCAYVLCPNGDMPPTPEGSCCPNPSLCPENAWRMGVSDPRLIQDEWLTSSGSKDGCTEASARLHSEGGTADSPIGMQGAWCASADAVGVWIEVDLGDMRHITGIATQGRSDANNWVESYTVKGSMNGYDWQSFYNEEYDHIFIGNSDRETVVTHSFVQHQRARYVRIYPQSWRIWPSLRFEVYGGPEPVVPHPADDPSFDYCVSWGDPHIRSFFSNFDDVKEDGERIFFQIEGITVYTYQMRGVINSKATITDIKIVTDDMELMITREDRAAGMTYGENHVVFPNAQSGEQWPKSKFPGKFSHMMTFDHIGRLAVFWHAKRYHSNGGFIDIGIRYDGPLDAIIGLCGPNPGSGEPAEPPSEPCGTLVQCCSKYSDDIESGCLIDYEEECCALADANAHCCDEMSPPDCTSEGCGNTEICDRSTKMCIPRPPPDCTKDGCESILEMCDTETKGCVDKPPEVPADDLDYNYCVTWGDPHIRGFFGNFDDAKENGDRTFFEIHNIIVSTSQQTGIFNKKATITHFEMSVDGNAFTVTREAIRNETSFGENHIILTKRESFDQWPRSKFPGRFDNMMTFDAAPDFAIFWSLMTVRRNGGFINIGIRYGNDDLEDVIGLCGPEPEVSEIPDPPETTCGALTQCCSRFASHLDDFALEKACLLDYENDCCNESGADETCCEDMSPPDCTIDGCGNTEICDETTKLCVFVNACQDVVCPTVVCPDGSQPPMSISNCCPDLSLCPVACAYYDCPTEAICDGPVEYGLDENDCFFCGCKCHNVACPEVLCHDGSLPPVRPGECCGDLGGCPDPHVVYVP